MGTRWTPRSVTDREIDSYREDGWVYLPGLVESSEAAEILALIDSVILPEVASDERRTNSKFEQIQDISLYHRDLVSLTRGPQLGQFAADLKGRPVRFWHDGLYRKMPTRLSSNAETAWHQDQPYLPFDRTAGPQVWLALNEVPPDRGSLRFLSGSHSSGLLGRALHDRSEDMEERVSELQGKYPMSEPLHLSPGDATVHHGMTVHFAPANTTDEARWAYIIQFFDANALYTGALTSQIPDPGGFGLQVNKPFTDERFPIVAWPKRLVNW
jgi:hypothetical protein